MDIPQDIVEKLVRLIKGERIPASSLMHPIITELLNQGVVQKQTKGPDKIVYYNHDPESLLEYIENNFGANSLSKYLERGKKERSRKSDSIAALSLEHQKRNVFNGFFVTSPDGIENQLNNEIYIIDPPLGTSVYFVSQFRNFIPPPDATIIGIDDSDNFKRVAKQKEVFGIDKVLFVFKQPHSTDLIRWLEFIPNRYLHFCDFDFSSLTIYYSQYKKWLGEKCNLFVPKDLEKLFTTNGDKSLYDDQLQFEPKGDALSDKTIQEIVTLIHRYKKGVKQVLK